MHMNPSASFKICAVIALQGDCCSYASHNFPAKGLNLHILFFFARAMVGSQAVCILVKTLPGVRLQSNHFFTP